MRSSTRLTHATLQGAITILLFATVAIGVTAAPSGVSTRLTRDFRAAVAQSTRELPGGITETVFLLAREASVRDQGTATDKESVVEVILTRRDATGAPINFLSGSSELAANALIFSSSLRSARLVARIPVTDFVTGASSVVRADLEWRASDTTTTQTLSSFNQNPSSISLTTVAERTRVGAIVSGSLRSELGTVSELTGILADQEVTGRTFLLLQSQAAPAQLTKTSVTLEGSALFANVNYATRVDSCVVAFVNVAAEIPAGEPARADVSVLEVDNCAEGTVVFQAADRIAIPGALTIAPDFSSARLNTTADVAGIPITLDLTWSGGQELSSETLRTETISPDEIVTAILQGKFSIATVAGSVTIPAHAIQAPEGSVGFVGSQFAAVTTTQN
jgi:hypothetical protein